MDANLLHISYEGGILEDPSKAPPKKIFGNGQIVWKIHPTNHK